MTDLLGVRDGVMRPLTVDAFERWLRSDDVERDGEMSAQQWAQLWFVMETIALWPEPSSDDEGTAVDAPVEAGDDATTNTAAKLADRGAADDDDAEGTAVRPSPAEARMADEIRQILRNNDDDTGVPSPGVMTHPDDLAAPLVRFALARGAAGVISGAHVGATGTNAIDALEWIRREKAQSVESLCGEHHADFTRAMRELDGVRDGMRRLGDATKAQNAEVQRAGGGLLESMDRFGSVANEEASIDEAVTKTRLCADALRCAARCDEALSRGDLLRAVRRCDEIEKGHVPGLPKGASALGEYLRDGVRKARARAERHANRSARDWLVAARDVGRVFGAAAIARETGRGVMSGGIGSGSGSGSGGGGGSSSERRERGRAAAAAEAAKRRDPAAALDAIARSIDAVRVQAAAAAHEDVEGETRGAETNAFTTQDGSNDKTLERSVSSGSSSNGHSERAAARRIDFTQEVMSLDAGPVIERENGMDSFRDTGERNVSRNARNFPDLASYVDEDAPGAVLSLKPLLQLWGVFRATNRGDQFAERIRKERASQLAADLDLGYSARRKREPDDCLREVINEKLDKFVGFFVVNERIARASDGTLASHEQNRAMCRRACEDLGQYVAKTLEKARDAAVVRALHDAIAAACAAIRSRGYGESNERNVNDSGNDCGNESNGNVSGSYLEGLERTASAAAASRYLDLLATHTVDEALDACTLERLHPLPDGKCSHAAKDLATFATEFATQIGGFYVGSASLRGGGTKSDGDIAREAAGKCRKCVETLAVEFPKRTSARPGFKESHAMQLVKDSEYLNNVAGTFERSAARAAVGAAADDTFDANAVGCHERDWRPFSGLERDAMNALIKMVTERMNELLETSSAQSDWAPDAPNQSASDACQGTVVYLDGILRTASVVVPKRNARELAASVFEHVSTKLMKPLAPEPSNGGSPAEVKKFTAFGVRNLDLDLTALETFADSMTVELAKDDYSAPSANNSNNAGNNPLRSLGRLRGAMRRPRLFYDLMTTDFDTVDTTSGTQVTHAEASRRCMGDLGWDDVIELERMAKTVDKYRELSATSKVMLQLKGAQSVLGFRPLGKKGAEGIGKALRARVGELKVALSRGVAEAERR